MEGEELQTIQTETLPHTDKWYTPLTRVTPLSKYFAMALFVVLPFVGFCLGNVTMRESYSEQSVVSGNDTQAFNSESADQTAKEVYKVSVSEQMIVVSKSDGTLVKEITPRDVPPQSTGTSKGGPGTLDNPERTYEFRPLNVEQESIIDSSRGRVYFRVTNTENIAPMSLKDMLYVYDITSGTTSLVIPPVFQLNILATGIAPDLRYVAYTEYHSVTVYDLVTARQVTSIDEPDTFGDDTGMQVKIKGWPNSSTLEYEIYHITPIVNTGYKKLVSDDSVFTLADTKRINVTTLNTTSTFESSENRNSTSVATPTPISSTASNIFTYDSEPGGRVGEMVLVKLERIPNELRPEGPGYVKAEFTGVITVTGRLSAPTGNPYDGGMGPEYSVATLNQDSLSRLPYFESDTRSVWFGVNNPEIMKESTVKNGDLVEVTIKKYQYVFYPAGVWNSAELIAIKKVQ
ncbi:MAG: hypothetical protein KBD24_01460 [Candidatus Pacebacteria bacterium]|nr:hypothetical protein [Candidatus Paceibacterota bacterium]